MSDFSSAENLAYVEALNKSIKSVRYFLAFASFLGFLYSSRATVWIEYASTFEDYSLKAASFIMYIDALLIGIVGTVFSTLGDYIGFDKSVTIKISLVTLGCFIEAFATSFAVLTIGFIISQIAILYVTVAYISWILPSKYAKIQISMLYSIGSVFYLLGPAFSGVMYGLLGNYQVIFIVNSILMAILLIISMICVYGKQKHLEEVQKSILFEDNIDETFPCTQKQNKETLNLNFVRDITKYQWYIIINTIIEIGIIFAFEAIMVTYYLPFMIRKFTNNKNLTLLCALQISLMSVSMSISMSMVRFCKRMNPNLLVIICLMISMVSVAFFSLDMAFHFYWITAIFFGLSFGAPTVILECGLLDVVPKRHAGKIQGIKSILHNLIRSIDLLFIGLYWNNNSMAYVIQIGAAIAIILHCSMWFVTNKANRNVKEDTTYDEIDINKPQP